MTADQGFGSGAAHDLGLDAVERDLQHGEGSL